LLRVNEAIMIFDKITNKNLECFISCL